MRVPLKYNEYALSVLIATEMLANLKAVLGWKVKRKAEEDPPGKPVTSVSLVHIHEARVRSGEPGNAASKKGVEGNSLMPDNNVNGGHVPLMVGTAIAAAKKAVNIGITAECQRRKTPPNQDKPRRSANMVKCLLIVCLSRHAFILRLCACPSQLGMGSSFS
jgi:hypothetical protein